MATGDLNPASWRIEIYEIKQAVPFSGYITDLSNLYTSELSIKKQRNYPDEITFTLDLAQLQARADLLGVDAHAVLEPYRHNVKIFRDNKFMAQGIVTKTSVNLNNESKNTIEVSCVDILGILEKRLIHQDYGGGSWADFAKEVIMDAQHEPNRIYNYAFEGDGIAIDNVWFRGWKFQPGDSTRDLFPDWEPNHLYSMYDRCNHDGKFWEAKEHAFYSGETFSESNWTLLGILDDETGDVAAAYAVWREDDVEPGPTGTNYGGWGGTSSCHMSGATMNINNGGDITSIKMAGSEVSTSLVAPVQKMKPPVSGSLVELEYVSVPNGSWFSPAGSINQDARVEVDIEPLDGTSFGPYEPFVAYNSSSTPSVIAFGGDTGSPLFFTYLDAEDPVQAEVQSVAGKHSYSIQGNKLFFDGKVVCAVPYRNEDGTPDKYSVGNIHIGSGKIYSAEITFGDGSYTRLIPCKNGNQVGFYSTKQNYFYSVSAVGGSAGPEVDQSSYERKNIYSRFMIKNLDDTSSKFKFFVEGHGGTPKVYSPEFTVTSAASGWQKMEYTWAPQDFDIYRFGVKITSGDMLADSPVFYIEPVEGDEWDLGVRVGIFPSVEEQTKEGWLRNRHTPTYEWKNAKATLLDLSNMDSDNFWYEVDENYKFNVRVNAGSDMVNVELSYPRNITSMSVSTDAGSIVNYVKGDGSAEVKQDPLASGVYVDQPSPFTWVGMNQKSMQDYWALASSERFDSERTIDSLKADIAAIIQTNSVIQDVPNVKIENNAVSPADVALGDIVSVSTMGIPYVKRANGLYKIVAYDIDVDIDGNESLALTLLNPTENQINALSFPQLVKNLINRVKG